MAMTYLSVIVYSLVLFFTVTLCQAQQRIVEAPNSIRVLRGTKGLLKCRVEKQVGAVQWTKNGFGLGSDRELTFYPTYSMVGSSAKGEFNLEIKPVTLSDEGEYRCQISSTSTEAGQASDIVDLTVLVPPSMPTFENYADEISATEGRELPITCRVDGAKPAPEISWSISGKPSGIDIIRLLDNDAEYNNASSITVEEDEHKMTKVRSLLRYRPRELDDGKYITCLVAHETLMHPIAAVAKLSIDYSPKVTITMNSTQSLKEGSSVTLFCEARAKPNTNLVYIWKMNGAVLQGKRENTLHIESLTKDSHDAQFECEVSNNIGNGGDSYVMELTYGPNIVTLPKRYNVNEGDTVTLRCEVDSNPPATIKWSRLNNPEDILFSGENYTLHTVNAWQKGAYKCEAESEGFPPASMITHISINGPPHVSLAPLHEVTEGQTIELICEIRGFPNPTKIWWSKDQTRITERLDKRFQLRQLPQEDGLVSILQINDLKNTDFGVFNCSASNDLGIDFAPTHLVRVDPFPLYYLIPAVVLVAVLLLCIVLVLVLINKRSFCHSKRSTTHSDAHSDVQVKVEALDGSGIPLSSYPDMYSPVPMNTELPYGPDYMSLPQDNPDLDLLPPPYAHYPLTNGMSTLPDGQMVHMTYIGDNYNNSTARISYSAHDISNGYGYPNNIHQQYYHPNESMEQSGLDSSGEHSMPRVTSGDRDSPPRTLTSTFVPTTHTHTVASDALLGRHGSTHV